MTHRRAHDRLRTLLYERFRLSPCPVIVGDGFAVPAASLWTGARRWVRCFRDAGVRRGDRVALAVPLGPASVMATIACWFEGITVACPREPADLADTLDARLRIADDDGPSTIRPDPAGDPPGPSDDDPDSPASAVTLREARRPPSPGAAAIVHAIRGFDANTRPIAYARLLAHLQGGRGAGSSHATEAFVTHAAPSHGETEHSLLTLWTALAAGATVIIEPATPGHPPPPPPSLAAAEA